MEFLIEPFSKAMHTSARITNLLWFADRCGTSSGVCSLRRECKADIVRSRKQESTATQSIGSDPDVLAFDKFSDVLFSRPTVRLVESL